MRPGPGLVVMALAFISGARRGSTSTSQQKFSSLTSSLSSSSLSSSLSLSSSSSSSSSPKSSLLLSPTSEYHYYQHQQEQHLPLEQRTRSNRHPSSPPSSYSSSTSSLASSSSKSSSSLYSLFHTLSSSGTSSDTSHQHPSSSLSSDYRNTFTIYNYDRNIDEIEQKYHFDNFKLDKLSYVNVEDYGENTEEIGAIGRSGGVGGGGSGGSSSWSDDAAEYDDREQDSEFFPGSVPSHSHIFESTSSLSRVNPWLSACDLAQPSSAPDLQGQCTAGSLPVAWVDEGPGPPTCPMSCEQLNLENKHNYNSNTNTNSYNSNNNNNYYKLHNYDNNYLINLNNNNNFNPVHNIMSKVRRDIVEKSGMRPTVTVADSGRSAKVATTKTNNGAAGSAKRTSSSSQKITTIKPPGVVERTTTTVSTASMNANKMVADKTVETTYNYHQQYRNQHQQKGEESERHRELDIDQDQYEDIMLNDAHANAQPSSSVLASESGSASTSTSSTQDHHYNYNNLDNYNNIVKNNLNNRKNVNNYNSYLNNNIYNYNNINNDKSNQYNQNQNQQQQCLDYLGDNDDSSPTQLCKNSRSDLDKKLRHLRLKHCCERTVLSALHTIALNVTLGGGPQCVRILTDIWDLDSLATRITCELAEILFRYDCRQIYSRIHQCKDCKEAYRRWVCSTLIPYFAENSSTISSKDSATTTKTTATSKSTNNNTNNKNQQEEPKQQEQQQQQEPSEDQFRFGTNDNDENFDRDRFQQDSLSLYDDDEDESIESPSISKQSLSETSSALFLRNSLKSAVIGQQYKQQQQKHSQHPLAKRAAGETKSNCKRTNSNTRTPDNIDERESSGSHQSEDSISTANNKDPCVEGTVISRLLTRTKRKIEFRKRRRIRPCRSVCETVEQKCPYLLPGDRAPAYPTQYAGEPTFLCLDQDIPETGEQLSKSNHGPPECCYRYCDPPTHGICIYCDDFDDGSGSKNLTTAANLRHNNTTLEERLGSGSGSSSQASGTPLSTPTNTRRSNATSIDSIDDLEKLPYYAYSGLVYYYDDIIDLPSDPLVECQPVPSITSRCTIPYYASSATATSYHRVGSKFYSKQRFVLIWSSIICFLVQNNILVTVHIPNDSNYRFYYYCCYNLNDWWRRLIGLLIFIISL